ncbi:MAG: DMT family transporter [Terriglobia bacterium]|jgi:drug/metabolite transporter (DMT)-like permease
MTLQLSRVRDWGLLILCNLIWASQYSMVKIVQEQMGPVFATFFPVTLATLLLIPIVRREAKQGNAAPVLKGDVKKFIIIGICGQIPAQLFITWGVGLSLASIPSLLALTLPVFTALMAYFILRERMTPLRWISFALALGGAIECSGISWGELSIGNLRFFFGSVLVLGGILGSCFFNVYSKKLLERYSPLQIILYSYYTTVGCMLPITLYSEPQGFLHLAHFSLRVWIGLIELALFVYFLSMVIFLYVLTRLDVTQAALSNYLLPFFGLVLAALLLHEKLTKFMIIGGILVLASTLVVTVYEESLGGAPGKADSGG